MKVALDIDGVLLDFDSHWQTFTELLLGRPLPRLNNEYDLRSRYGLSEQESKLAWEAFYDQGQWAQILPYRCAIDAIDDFHLSGHTLLCITAAPRDVEVQRRKSLQNLGLDAHHIEFIGYHHDGNTKHEALLRHQPDVFIDDQLYNLLHGKECDVEHRIWLDRGDAQINIDHDNWQDVATHRAESLTAAWDAIAAISPLTQHSSFK